MSIENYVAFVFGDETTTEATASLTEEISQAVDISFIDPIRSALTLTTTGSTAGSVALDVSLDGATDWVEVFLDATAYASAGTIVIPMTSLGFGNFFRARVTDTSTNSGSIQGFITARPCS